MDLKFDEGLREKTRRPIRNKRFSRRIFSDEKKPPKRLFTPEIKKYLKDWLVRRRDNPYPSREEKKILAVQTGLTYIQVCNWFANWRRKLKNSGKEPLYKTWGELIKIYNSQVHGNVEHFSICSDDSIWEEAEEEQNETNLYKPTQDNDHSYIDKDGSYFNNNNQVLINQCFLTDTKRKAQLYCDENQSVNKYKNNIMEKYLRDCQNAEINQKFSENLKKDFDSTSVISKWLESAVNFKPCKSSFLDMAPYKIQKKNGSNLKPNLQNNFPVKLSAKKANGLKIMSSDVAQKK